MSEDFQPGSVLAGYRLEALVGSGGMADVWKARDKELPRSVALKIMASALAADPANRQRFIAEARHAATVNHPHIIPVYEAREADGVLFIAMQFVPGGDLGMVLKREGVLPPERAMEFISPVASALDAAHAAGLVHRDVKPANILVDAQVRPEHVYLSDFGIAKTEQSATLTVPGIMVGTAAYSAPEQISGLAVDGRADQYALACLAYRLLSGQVPFPRDQLDLVLMAHRRTPPPQLTALRPDLPAAADRVLARAMDKSPGKRYASCGEFADRLRGALRLRPYRSRASGILLPPRRRTQAPAEPEGPSPAPPATPAEPDTGTLTRSAAAQELYQALPAPARKPASTQRVRGQRRHQVQQILVSVMLLAVLGAAAAVITVALTRNTGTSGQNHAGSLTSASAFAGYPGQQGTVTVNSIAAADGTSLAAGTADGHPAIWRRGAGRTWTLASASSPAVARLSGALTGIAHGPDGWLAVGNLGAPAGAAPVQAVTSGDGLNWQVSGATFGGIKPLVAGAAASQAGYVVVGTTVSSYNSRNRIVALWRSPDLRSWTLSGSRFAKKTAGETATLNGKLYGSDAAAVFTSPTGSFYAVGSSYGNNSNACAVWTAGSKGNQWTYESIPLPLAASSAALGWVTVNSSGLAVGAGHAALIKGGNAPLVVVDAGGQWNPVVLDAPGGQGAVTALTATATGFIVAGEAGPAGARHAVIWDLPDSRNPLSSWGKIPPGPAPGNGQKVTALFASGNLTAFAAQQGQGAIFVERPVAAASAG